MPHDAGSSRHVDKRMKMAGLGRLRWYCTPCEKQCRDANAFKQHCLSESHVRRIQNIGNVKDTINDQSKMFQSAFIQLLRTSHQEKPVHSNRFYQTYIADKEHVHMNSTKWNSLAEFVKHLGREGLCRVEEKEDGLFIAWIDRSPEALMRADKARRMENALASDQMREEDLIQRQIKKAREQKEQAEAAAAAKLEKQQQQQTASTAADTTEEQEQSKLDGDATAPAPAAEKKPMLFSLSMKKKETPVQVNKPAVKNVFKAAKDSKKRKREEGGDSASAL